MGSSASRGKGTSAQAQRLAVVPSAESTMEGLGGLTDESVFLFKGLAATGELMLPQPIEKMSIEEKLQGAFPLIERLYQQLDADKSGNVYFETVLFRLRSCGLRGEAWLKQCFAEYVDCNNDGRLTFYELLGLLVYWQARKSAYEAVFFAGREEKLVSAALTHLAQMFFTEDKNKDRVLAQSEIKSLFQTYFPRLPDPDAVMARLGQATTVTLPQFVAVVYVAVRGDNFMQNWSARDGPGDAGDPSDPLAHRQRLLRCFAVLEKDYRRTAPHGAIALEDILVPREHPLSPAPPPPRAPQTCEGCGAGRCEYGCPHAACRFAVCAACYAQGLRAHVAAPGGPGTKVQRDAVVQLIRGAFAAVDADRDGSLDLFEYMALGAVVSTHSHYTDLAVECADPGVVKQTLCWLQRHMPSAGAAGPGMTYPELRAFCEHQLGLAPADRAWFDTAQRGGRLRVQALCEFLHARLRRPAPAAGPGPPRTARRAVYAIPDREASFRQQQQPVFTRVDPDRVKKLKQLGAGGQCTAFLVTYAGTQCVAKVPKAGLDDWTRRHMVTAAALQQTITSPFVAQVLGICTAPARELVLTEFCPRGSVDGLYNATSLSLSDDHNPIARPLQWRIAHELAQALRFMHDAGVMHRDVKGANVLLTQGRHVKLADFDLATRDATSTHTLGTPGYMAPEVMAAAETGAPYDRGCDVFAFGGVLFELSHNLPPFYIAPEGRPFEAYWEALKREVMAPKRPTLNMNRVTPAMRDLMMGCWAVSAHLRPKMPGVVQALEAMQEDYFRAPSGPAAAPTPQ